MSDTGQPSFAWVTLATNDKYAVGALVLAQSLRNVGTIHKIHILYTPGVSQEMRAQLHHAFDNYTEVNILDSSDAENLALIGRPDLGVTFTKLHCWKLIQYEKCVFLDADTFVVRNCDELFEHPEFSAAPDIGWPDYFNTGVFVFVPSEQTYNDLVQFALKHGTFDGGDQGLLNQYFSSWRDSDHTHRLRFVYNVTTVAIYGYAAAIKRNEDQVKIVHFIGKQKPWMITYSRKGAGEYYVNKYTQQWTDVYNRVIRQQLPPNLLTLTTDIGFLNLRPFLSPETSSEVEGNAEAASQTPTTESGYDAWEAGIIDYTGADSFENIQKAINKALDE